ncbi:MAG: PilZ domain-containing protein [Spirochaetota bacterium]
MKEKNSMFSRDIQYDTSKQNRKEARLNVDLQCEILHGKYRVAGNILEIGVGGIKFESNTLFYADEKVILEFFLNKDVVQLAGTIQRVSGKHAVVQTDTSDEELNKKIQDFIYNYYNSKDLNARNNPKSGRMKTWD